VTTERYLDPPLLPLAALTRRRFGQGLVASVASAVLVACDRGPPERILPYVVRPPELIPGVGSRYATSTVRDGYGFGLLAESQGGRPIKLDGHPQHPASLGATSAVEQAEIHALYDPDRLQGVQGPGVADWTVFRRQLKDKPWFKEGAGLHLLLEASASPLRKHLLERLRERYPAAQVHFGTGNPHAARWQASRTAFGAVLRPRIDLGRARRIVALDADLFGEMPEAVAWARAFANGRGRSLPENRASRLYAVETSLSVTGASADQRLALAPSELPGFTAALLVAIGLATGQTRALDATQRTLDGGPARFLKALANDLLQHRGSSVVIAGERQPATVHALVHALNQLLDAPGQALSYVEDPLIGAGGAEHDIDQLLSALDRGAVKSLIVLGCNPAYELPPDSHWAERFGRVPDRVHLTRYADETSAQCQWVLPQAHFLESWGDERGPDGTLSFTQPLIRPIFSGRSVDQLLLDLLGDSTALVDLLAQRWSQERPPAPSFAQALARGVVAESASPPVQAKLRMDAVLAELGRVAPAGKAALELEIAPDPRIGGGRHANNAYLQELGDPITKLAWGNAALLAPETARRYGIESGDVVELEASGASIRLPALIVPGQHPRAVTLHSGYGRSGGESSARGAGVDVGPLRSQRWPWLLPEVTLSRTGARKKLALLQRESEEHGYRPALREELRAWQKHPNLEPLQQGAPPSILPERVGGDPQWGMAIDLDRCMGCGSCVVACQIENNVPTVGADQVALGREMHWLRVDRYYEERKGSLKLAFQPMLCQHCEKAPCEYVCPVNATVHSPDGLNEMVYNRCVGTRYCSNNCPYKVRRFNFLNYNDRHTPSEELRMNPNVTVRSRGVMEKCTYCVQRIRRAGIEAKIAGRTLRDDEVKTACQEACPSAAIVFGPVSRPSSEVARLHANPRAYAVLNELGTRPRTRYLLRLDNPNPELAT
jgi:Fe-S-cluster-containing dehydrogenase component